MPGRFIYAREEEFVARNAYRGSKRRRELDKKKKRAEKLARKQNKDDSTVASENDTSYLEYLHPGGVPEELLPDSGDDIDEESDEESDDESEIE
jgi:hypothetical protein